MATAPSRTSSATSQDQETWRIFPDICSVEGGSAFAISTNQDLQSEIYYVRFSDYGTIVASRDGIHHLHGQDPIPAALRRGDHEITVEVSNKEKQLIGTCLLQYIDEKANLIQRGIPETPDALNVDSSSDATTDDERLYDSITIDMPMLEYFCDAMARKGDTHFFRALKRLGVMEKVSGNRSKYFKDFATTARQHGHKELAVEIDTSRKPCYEVEMPSLGELRFAIYTERSLANVRQSYLIEPENDIALIISNRRFEGATEEGVELVERRGSEANVKILKGLLEELGYTVKIKENQTAMGILETVQEMAKEINGRKNSSSFVCFIGTHGDKGKIYGADSKSIDVKEVTGAFKADNCPGLRGKPKLFFIEACGVSDDLNDSDCLFRSRLDPAEPHFLIAISLAPENVSFKSEKDGTWIVNALTEMLKKHYQDEDVCSMLLKVNDLACKTYAEKGYKQPCQLVFSTTKMVKLPQKAGSEVPRMGQLAIEEKCLKNGTTEQQRAQSHRADDFWSYPMNKQYNVAVIINVKHFLMEDGKMKFDDREGSDVDVTELKRWWKSLGFTVKVPNSANPTSQSILTFLQEVAKEIDEKQNSSCFVCCIMTHGRMGNIYGSDNAPVDINVILDLFKNANCPALAGMPKLFFIQACRPEIAGSIQACRPEIAGSSASPTSAVCDASENSEFVVKVNPHESDFLIGYSTLPGKYSHLNKKRGTWYIQALVEIFQKYHKEEHVVSLMTRINAMLEHTVQCPAPVLTLTRKFYFSSSTSALGEKGKNA